MDDIKPSDLFGTCDLDGSGYIDREELAAVCDLDPTLLGEVFNKLDADRDGRISIEEFSDNFSKFKSVVSGLKQIKREGSLAVEEGEYDELSERLGKAYNLLSGQEYVAELFQQLHRSTESPQLLALLESFLFSVVRDVKHYSSENERMEEALKRTCEKHNEHMEHMDDEVQQQMSGLETRIRQEERSKYERANLDIVWQLEAKNKEIQQLQAEVQKVKGRLKRKEPEEQKLKEQVDERVQEIRYLRSQITDAQTNHAVLRSELAQMRNDYEEQTELLNVEKRTVMECIQEQESLTRQLQLLHEANKKLHDTNDDLRSALEGRKYSDGRSPSPSKRHSISTLYSSTKKKKASNLDDQSPSSTLSMTSTPHPGSRRSSLLPTQQPCEVDGEGLLNESSLMTELMQVKQLSRQNDGEEDEAYGTMPPSERESFKSRMDMLQETNKRLCERNDDLRLALEAISGRKHSAKVRKGDKSRRNPSVHSDYGSVSSRSITPNHLQGPKSEEDVADGAEADDLSGYDVESDGNTMTTSAHHFEGPPELGKLGATPHGRLEIAGVESARNDVEWESAHENDTAEHEEQQTTDSKEKKITSDTSPFDRNSNLRRPCRHKSLEQLCGSSSGKGDRSTWPEIARAGKWNSMEQMRKKHEYFGGERSKSLPTSRWQSYDRVNSSDGSDAGLWQLTEKLNSLRSSRSTLEDSADELINSGKQSLKPPAYLVAVENFRTEIQNENSSSVSKPTSSRLLSTQGADSNHGDASLPSNGGIKGAQSAHGKNCDKTSLESILNHAKTDSLPESETSRAESLLNYAELEAQFKSVIEEDPDDIDEDDVRDEELAKLVAMASGNSDSETETEPETPEGERLAAVGSDSLSDGSMSMPLSATVSQDNVPERMYKLVLAGDAAVGKSSFILRLCRNRFHSALNSTLGVDFQMKTLSVDGKNIALQLWDTAGQERFRSIAKSYFRKADGVLLLYDVTYETSFINVRDWVEAIEESSSKSIPIMLCGNKTDLRESQVAEGKSVITEESGRKLAKEYGALFAETSAKDNKNVAEACMELARLLCTLEDQEVEQSSGLKLTDMNGKSKAKPNCCPA